MSFPLAGNKNIQQSVTNSIKENRLPHAIIIEGDPGTGRHTLASYIAAAAVCEDTNSPCGMCKGCRMASGGNHPDITVTAPEEGKKNIAVAQIRQLKGETAIKPHQAKRRVFIIDFADTMNEQSQNALLKVLEEPPGPVMFILIAETKAALLETVISRCVVLTLNPPEADEALHYISQNHSFPTENIKTALESSQNNIGKALLLLAGSEDDKIALAAKSFVSGMQRRNLWEMLSATAAAEKNRLEADRFFKALKLEISENLRKNPHGHSAQALSKFYTELCRLEKSLALNINLSLLFCTLVSKAAETVK